MTKSRTSSSFLALTLLIAGCGESPSQSAEPTRATLEKAWKAYVKACRSGDEIKFKQTVSAYHYGTFRNHLASAGERLTPESIRGTADDVADEMDIAQLPFVTVIRKGSTAGLVYQQKEEGEPDQKIRNTFVLIKFVKEGADWKVEEVIGHLDVARDEKADGQTGFDPADVPSRFAIDGKIREAPKPMPISEVAGWYDIFSYGYSTVVTINGVPQTKAEDGIHSGIVLGGLKSGENRIEIAITKIEGKSASTPTVTIRQMIKKQKGREVFKFEPKEKIEGRHNLRFLATSREKMHGFVKPQLNV